MANAKKCDRCDSLYEHYTEYNSAKESMNGVAFVCVNEAGKKYMSIDVCDLCPECLKSFKKWWDKDHIILSDEQVKEFEKDKETDEKKDWV